MFTHLGHLTDGLVVEGLHLARRARRRLSLLNHTVWRVARTALANTAKRWRRSEASSRRRAEGARACGVGMGRGNGQLRAG